MAVFRIEKTRDYTVMANHHLRNTALSLKAKGLLSLMLSLPEDWDYTTKGLARICRDGVDSICATVRELEDAGYIIRERVRNANGRLGSIEYTILEQPRPPEPKPGKPERENPVQVKPVLDSPVLGKPEQENPAQLNTKGSSKQISNTDSSSTEESNPIQSSPQTPTGVSRTGRDWMRERENYRELILENIEYDYLCRDDRLDRDMLNELVELMVDTVCSRRETIRIAGDDYPAEVVKSRFLKLNSSHIEYVLDRMRDNTTYVRNIKKYLLAALYNAPATIDSYYASLVNHDLYGSGERRYSLVQEEVTQRTVTLCVEATKLSAGMLQQAMKKVLDEMQKGVTGHKTKLHHGKQTLRQLMKHNTGVSNIEITDQNIRAFSVTAKKYGIDFALKKDTSGDIPRYLVFFKGRDADVITAAFREFSAKNLEKEKKPSIRKELEQAKQQSKAQHRQREKVKTKDRGVEL